jgi:hypothetical protein
MRILVATFVVLPAVAFAQQQVVKPPVAQYWVSVETAAGMSIPGMGSIMAGAMGGQGQAGRRMALQLGSQRPADGPRADHEIPPGMSMGPSLPLVTPRQAPRETADLLGLRRERAAGAAGRPRFCEHGAGTDSAQHGFPARRRAKRTVARTRENLR